MELSFQEMYNAIGKPGSPYEGLFVTAVTSTGIFCRPSCRARKPLAKNVVFYKNSEQALKNGYRPCKICKPIGKIEAPLEIRKLIEKLQNSPYEKIKDEDLKQRGLEPSYIRRWFKRHHNMTFHGYQRLIRINTGFNQIQKGDTVTKSAFDSGYDSLSGFNDGFKSIFGLSPKHSKHKSVIHLQRISTKLGPMFAGATNKGLCLLEFTDRRMLEFELKDLRKRLNAIIIPQTNEHIILATKELDNYLERGLKKFSVQIDAPGTEFQKRVWDELVKIPYGHTCSYQEQANKIGRPKAMRAVARANGMNRIAIIVPCHRVIGSHGDLTGYGGGLPRKKWLLELERHGPKHLPPPTARSKQRI